MVGNPLVQGLATSIVFSSPLIHNSHGLSYSLPYLPSGSQKHVFFVKATSANSEQDQPLSSSGAKNPLSVVFNVPHSIWKHTLRPPSDFGFGKRSIWEGGMVLFLVSGAVLLALNFVWLKGFHIRSKFKKYLAVFEFPQACGICIGTPVRIRGVNVGKVIRVNPSLKNVEAVVEVDDDKIFIPRNSLVEVNQSGLLMETKIDITPKDSIPMPSVGPLDPECDKEGYIVCDRQTLKGYQGVSLDALVGISTRIVRELEGIDVAKSYAQAKRVADAIIEAQPLLSKDLVEDVDELMIDNVVEDFMHIEAMIEDIQPLLSEVRDSGLLKNVECLTRSLKQATEDLRRVHSSAMTPDNTELIQKSIHSLISTLENIESISSDILRFTSDKAIRHNLKLLIKSLSRLL